MKHIPTIMQQTPLYKVEICILSNKHKEPKQTSGFEIYKSKQHADAEF